LTPHIYTHTHTLHQIKTLHGVYHLRRFTSTDNKTSASKRRHSTAPSTRHYIGLHKVNLQFSD
jgi:hypothetical protein